jgi:pimeloyl-ACP methyl ester carboxylesterase
MVMSVAKASFGPSYDVHVGTGRSANVVAVRGGGFRDDVWAKQMPLADRYDMLLFSGNAFGTADARALLDALKERQFVKPHLVGHSFGTKTCMAYCRLAAHEPGYSPASLTLITPVKLDFRGISVLTRVMVFIESLGEAGVDRNLLDFVRNRSGLPRGSRVEVCDNHFPFQTDAAAFNRKLIDLIENMNH